jgi:dipeptidyl aminopeptidase/acylaminoacyl peptidase
MSTPKPPAKRSSQRAFTVEDLWALDRIGNPSLAPDGSAAVVAVGTPSMDENKTTSAIWLLPIQSHASNGQRHDTELAPPRRLTHAGDKDGYPAFSPRGDAIAFKAKREQHGVKDQTSQLYLLPTQGGEAQRVGMVATGVEAFRWTGCGKRLAFLSWVWPQERGQAAQAKRMAQFKARKESGYATAETVYRYWDQNLPMGRVVHLHVMDVATGKVRDLLEGTPYELSRAEPDAHAFDTSPDGQHIAFAFDPNAEKRLDHCQALAEVNIKSGAIKVLAAKEGWNLVEPTYSPDGTRIAFLASHLGRNHTMPAHLAVLDRKTGAWQVVSAAWDHSVQGPLRWSVDGHGVYLAAERRGRRLVWRFDVATRQATAVTEGGWVEGFDVTRETLVTVASSASHPGRMHVHDLTPSKNGDGPKVRRIESFNDAQLASMRPGRVEERWIKGALGDQVQMWLVYPPGFDAETKAKGKTKKPKTWPLMHVIHGGPHTAFGDAWHYRWNTQVFAAQGYVTAAVNYHGSTGFGYAFTDSITHRWGELELKDVEAATTALLKEPWVDAKRVYATGGSYGGYMVAWMNGHVAPGRYAAYVCHAGCYDWRAMMATDAFTWFPKELGAAHWKDEAATARQSPITFAGRMQTPTLVVHGALDYRVPDAQGLAYYNTLKSRGVDARLLWFPDENHWVLKPRNSLQWYGEFFAWLDGHTLGKPNTQATSKAGGKRTSERSSKPSSKTLGKSLVKQR